MTVARRAQAGSKFDGQSEVTLYKLRSTLSSGGLLEACWSPWANPLTGPEGFGEMGLVRLPVN